MNILKKIGSGVVEAFLTIGRGDILLKIGAHRWLKEIAFAFGVVLLSILLSIWCDQTLSLREKKLKELDGERIIYSSKYREMVSLYRYTTVEDMLEKAGSKLEPLREPAVNIE